MKKSKQHGVFRVTLSLATLVMMLTTTAQAKAEGLKLSSRFEVGPSLFFNNGETALGGHFGVIPRIRINNHVAIELKSGLIYERNSQSGFTITLMSIPIMPGVYGKLDSGVNGFAHAGPVVQRVSASFNGFSDSITEVDFALGFGVGYDFTDSVGINVNMSLIMWDGATPFRLNPNLTFKI